MISNKKKWIVLKPIDNVLGPGQIKILLLQKQIENEKDGARGAIHCRDRSFSWLNVFPQQLWAQKEVSIILPRTRKNLTHRHLNLNSCKNRQVLIENNWHCEDIVDYNVIQRDDEDHDDANGLTGEPHYQAGGILTYSTGRWEEIMRRMRKPSFVGGNYSENALPPISAAWLVQLRQGKPSLTHSQYYNRLHKHLDT